MHCSYSLVIANTLASIITFVATTAARVAVDVADRLAAVVGVVARLAVAVAVAAAGIGFLRQVCRFFVARLFFILVVCFRFLPVALPPVYVGVGPASLPVTSAPATTAPATTS